MKRPLRLTLAPAAALLPLALLACGTGQAAAADRAGLEARAEAIRTTTDSVYVTSMPGFVPAVMSVSDDGNGGFQEAYADLHGSVVQLRVEYGTVTDANCPQGGINGFGDGTTTCERDGAAWYRTTSDAHEYALNLDGRVLRINSSLKEADRATLRAAVRSAHLADDRELDETLPPLRDHQGPTERGDLPPGDGAPDNRPPEGMG
ncbi:hypothetical protein ACMATS_04050 [Streptoverticillium reticulum]|uniref:hypothetical protein n=1 Tax=Streptoverticillium reticulum TaxID=1433415 RepID=UPI0039BFF27C